MRVPGLDDSNVSQVFAGGNPCFSEVTGQTIPGCTPPGSTPVAVLAATAAQTSAVPSWVWWAAAGLALVLFAGSD